MMIRTCFNVSGCDLNVERPSNMRFERLKDEIFVGGVAAVEMKAHRLATCTQARRTARTKLTFQKLLYPRVSPRLIPRPEAYRLRAISSVLRRKLRFEIPDNP
ncbi:hypothetical protein E3N88_10799 [Mikania micrantha]|uniref:Uncharacterized protein n=1 Tax=Mikania micrantha TaxID=192012 RepID=A0A5N6PCM8_9ASTR|nr:hypothetical protein E3N88_10799 [Mikania micrantha]